MLNNFNGIYRLKQDLKKMFKLGSASCKTYSPKSRKNWSMACDKNQKQLHSNTWDIIQYAK